MSSPLDTRTQPWRATSPRLNLIFSPRAPHCPCPCPCHCPCPCPCPSTHTTHYPCPSNHAPHCPCPSTHTTHYPCLSLHSCPSLPLPLPAASPQWTCKRCSHCAPWARGFATRPGRPTCRCAGPPGNAVPCPADLHIQAHQPPAAPDLQVRWPAWKCCSLPCRPSHPGTPTPCGARPAGARRMSSVVGGPTWSTHLGHI